MRVSDRNGARGLQQQKVTHWYLPREEGKMNRVRNIDIDNLRTLASSLRFLLDDTCEGVRYRAILPRDRNAASNILVSVEYTFKELSDAKYNDTQSQAE